VVAGLRAFDVALLDPRHQAAEAGAGLLDRVLLAVLEQLVELLVAGLGLLDPFLGELAGLDVLERLLHADLHRLVDDGRADFHVAPLGGLGDGETHAGDAGFVHEIDDELQLMQALEVGHLRGVAGFHQHFKTGLDEGAGTAAKHGLLTKEIGLGFFLEGGFDDTAASAANAVRPGEGDLLGLLVGVLMDGDEGGHAFAFGVLAADDVAGAFRGHHDHVHVLRRHDGLVENGEAVGEQQRLALCEVGGDVFLVHAADLRVRHGDEDDVSGLHSFCGVHNLETLLLSHLAALGTRVEADDDFDAALLEVQGVGVALGAEADFQRGKAGVFFSVDFGRHDGVWFEGRR